MCMLKTFRHYVELHSHLHAHKHAHISRSCLHLCMARHFTGRHPMAPMLWSRCDKCRHAYLCNICVFIPMRIYTACFGIFIHYLSTNTTLTSRSHTQIVQSQQEMMMRREQERAYTETVVFSQIHTEIRDSKAETDRLRSVLAEIGREGGPVAQMTNEYRSYRYDAYECVYVYISVSVCVLACVCMYVCMCLCAAYVCGHRCVSYKRSHALASVVNTYSSMHM